MSFKFTNPESAWKWGKQPGSGHQNELKWIRKTICGSATGRYRYSVLTDDVCLECWWERTRTRWRILWMVSWTSSGSCASLFFLKKVCLMRVGWVQNLVSVLARIKSTQGPDSVAKIVSTFSNFSRRYSKVCIILHRDSLHGNLFHTGNPCADVHFVQGIPVQSKVFKSWKFRLRDSLRGNLFRAGNPCVKHTPSQRRNIFIFW